MKNIGFLLLAAALLLGCRQSGPPFDPAQVSGKLDALNSYRQNVALEFTPNAAPDQESPPESQQIEVTMSIVKDPPAQDVLFRLQGPDSALAQVDQLRFVQIGDTFYSELPGLGCVQSNMGDMAGLGSPTEGIPTVDQLLASIKQAVRVEPDEEVNGVLARHYEFDEADVEESAGITTLDGDLYVATDGDYPVQLIIKGDGSASFLDPTLADTGSFSVQIDIFDANAELQIVEPENCDPLGP